MHKQGLILLFFLLIFTPVLAQQQGNASYYSYKLKGRKVSDETREKLRLAVLGKKRGPYKKKGQHRYGSKYFYQYIH